MVSPLIPTTPRAPYDRYTARHAGPGSGDSAGGPPRPAGIGHTLPFGVDNPMVREGTGANTWDRDVDHERMPWYDRDYVGSHHDTLTNWTDSGPIRASLHMMQSTRRKLVGTDNTRNLDPHPTARGTGTQQQGHGMHTNPVRGPKLSRARYLNTVQQQPARINRISPARYAGQTYSQTTQVQGA